MAVVFFLAGVAVSFASPRKRLDPGTNTCRIFTFQNLQDGQKIFKTVCKSCHHQGNSLGAQFLHTESKGMRAWNRLFLEKYAKCAKDGSWDALSEDDLLKLNDYLFRYASDTYDPNDAADCG